MEHAIADDTDGAPDERVLVWADGGLVFDAGLPDTGADENAYWESLPRLLGYVRGRADTVPHVVALVDRTGGDLFAMDALGRLVDIDSVDGTTLHVRKVKVGGWSHLRYLHRAEERWKANAKQVAAAVDRLVEEVVAERLVVAGDVRARQELRDELGARSSAVLGEVDAGGRGGSAAGIDENAFNDAVRAELAATAKRDIDACCAEFSQRLGKDGAAVEGLPAVTNAAAQGTIDTLLIGPDFAEDTPAWIGPAGDQVALAMADLPPLPAGAALAAPAGSALLRAVATTDAQVLAVDSLAARDGIGALLRY